MPLSYRENYLRNVRLTGPEYMPCAVSLSNAEWDMWREDLEDVCLRHPLFFPGFQKGQRDYDNFDFGPAHRAWITKDRSEPGHIGQPHLASAEKGEILLRAFTSDVVALLERVIDWDGREWDA